MVGDVRHCTPNPLDACEDLHEIVVDIDDEWHMDDQRWRAMMRLKRM